MPKTIGVSFRAQVWNDQAKTTDIAGLSYDAAREIASAGTLTGHTGRIMSEEEDYCEVFTPDGFRAGTFAETTFLRMPKV